MSSKSERRAALQRVATYHDTCLARLVDHIGIAIDRYRDGELTVSDVDTTIHQYHRAARELWKFCWADGGGAHTEVVAHAIDHQLANDGTEDWWQRGEPRRR